MSGALLIVQISLKICFKNQLHANSISNYFESINLSISSIHNIILLWRNKAYDVGIHLFVCVEVLRPSQPNGVMLSAVSLPNHMFTGQV